jgi:uncharacterized membrane protein
MPTESHVIETNYKNWVSYVTNQYFRLYGLTNYDYMLQVIVFISSVNFLYI